MTYMVRGAAISLGIFFLTYCALSGSVALGWNAIRTRATSLRASQLFALRMLPFAATLGIACLLTIPSFILLEPDLDTETLGLWGATAVLGGVAVILFGLANTIPAWLRTTRFVAGCARSSPRWKIDSSTEAIAVSSEAPGLLVAGVFRPKILISRKAGELLDAGEFQAAIRHELFHVQHHDNLKKLLLRFCAFPFLGRLDRHWIHAAEIEADDAAASDPQTAVDLASALIKMAREMPRVPTTTIVMALVSNQGDILANRVQRLLNWQPRVSTGTATLRPMFMAAIMALTALGFHYGWVLTRTHELTELLVR
jgi:beta-lactamase regulating signal transducer with metallopeptidase domain